MTQLIIKPTDLERAKNLVKDAIKTKIALLEHLRQRYLQKLDTFEKKYNVTSDKFIKEWAAEDLDGKDMEYIEWAGEYHCFLDLEEDLRTLKSINYVIE
jgi:hypothetical protein